MKNQISKEKILAAAIEKQDALINNFNSQVTEMRGNATGQEQSASQNEDRGAGDDEVLGTMETASEFAQVELATLKTLDATAANEKVEPGAVVVTDQRIFFIAVSTEKIEVDGETIFGISTNAPIYQVMAGLTKGDVFEFNGTSYKIEEIY